MLCQFSVRNFKSIRDRVTFDMQATSISEHDDQVIVDSDGEKFLPVSVIYGPNGGGKTTILQAINALVTVVVNPIYITQIKSDEGPVPIANVKPFEFSDKTKNAPTEFEIFFRTTLAEYRYQMQIKQGRIIFENLDRRSLKTGRRSGMFTRNVNNIELKGSLKKLSISKGISDTLPFLSYLGITYNKKEYVKDVISWFMNSFKYINYGVPYREIIFSAFQMEEYKSLILDMMKEMDIDIEDYRVEKKDKDHVQIYTKHNVNGRSSELLLEEESSGTLKLFNLLPFIAESLLKGTTLIIDELDAKLHPLLLENIIERYTDFSVNRKNAQLIFTSHDLSTMSNKIFRRDEIWFVAKGNAQNSQLYSLVEFKNDKGEKVRKDATYDKQYLEGRYGADPYLRKIINWEET